MLSKLLTAILIYSLTLSAQDQNFFPKPGYFRETLVSPNMHVELKPPTRLADFVEGGKLELSLRSYIELVMANNTDIAVTKLNIDTAKNAILRGFAPFDPFVTASFNTTRTKTPSTSALDAATTLGTLSQPVNFNYAQTLQNGTSYNVTFSETKFTTNSGFAILNPAFNSGLSVAFTQPLIKNRGMFVNRIPIMLAQSRLKKAGFDLRASLITLLTTAELAYWQTVQLRENLRVQESALDLADKFLKRSQRELELGAISKLDIYQPQLQFVQAQASVSQATYLLRQQEDALRKQMGADLDPDLRKLPIVLTESVAAPLDGGRLDAEMLIEKALLMRPDLRSQMQDLDTDDLTIKQVSNALKPDLSLTGVYTSQGIGGTFFQRTNVFTGAVNANGIASQSTVTQILPGGFGDSLDQLFGFGFPVYGFGIRLRLPIRNRQAAADMADALVNKRRDALQIRSTEQQVRLDVLTSANLVESSKVSLDLAIKSRDFAQKRLDAENKKYELGTSQIFLVLQAQTDLINAESNVVIQSINYKRNILNMLQTTGELLQERGVVVQ
jgi:outer membrane protein TolC